MASSGPSPPTCAALHSSLSLMLAGSKRLHHKEKFNRLFAGSFYSSSSQEKGYEILTLVHTGHQIHSFFQFTSWKPATQSALLFYTSLPSFRIFLSEKQIKAFYQVPMVIFCSLFWNALQLSIYPNIHRINLVVITHKNHVFKKFCHMTIISASLQRSGKEF